MVNIYIKECLNALTSTASTVLKFKQFQILVTLSENENFLMLDLQSFLYSLKQWPLVEVVVDNFSKVFLIS